MSYIYNGIALYIYIGIYINRLFLPILGEKLLCSAAQLSIPVFFFFWSNLFIYYFLFRFNNKNFFSREPSLRNEALEWFTSVNSKQLLLYY